MHLVRLLKSSTRRVAPKSTFLTVRVELVECRSTNQKLSNSTADAPRSKMTEKRGARGVMGRMKRRELPFSSPSSRRLPRALISPISAQYKRSLCGGESVNMVLGSAHERFEPGPSRKILCVSVG